jgi:hypothetical protein
MSSSPVPWTFSLSKIERRDSGEFLRPLETAEVSSLDDIFVHLSNKVIADLDSHFELRVEARSSEPSDKPVLTRLEIVNLPVNQSSQLYVDLLKAIFTQHLVYPREVFAVCLQRRLQNYQIQIDLRNYGMDANEIAIAKTVEFCENYQRERIGGVNSAEFCVDLFPVPRRKGAASGAKKVSMKNTADSAVAFLRKRGN